MRLARMVQSSRSSESSGSSGGDSKILVGVVQSSRSSESSGSIVFEKYFFGRGMITSGVEAIGRREDLPGIEHASKHLFHECMILTCLYGECFGAQWDATGL